ncbi:BrnA antitoxin family protein [Paenibacillus alkaliterrae]|uniref:CopG family antitoxin n=1 Tax=Paenibacillus alkaliterrae TaxID=320909 RepID=UPI001F345F74|nr:CopG family antitoxin [Paenibacillus alkaliterrae]MCF2938196.1 BrnA antitoxin family protein [Paenibacillus alkaliterrae]
MKRITSREEIPTNMTDEEAADFWATHTMSSELLEASTIEDDLPRRNGRTKTISIRLEHDLLERIQEVAAQKHMGYQTLMKQFLIERVYEEEKAIR